jgi:hypothetical protein
LGLIGSAAASAIPSLRSLRESADADFGLRIANAMMMIDPKLRPDEVGIKTEIDPTSLAIN